jgi:hypothetical protein
VQHSGGSYDPGPHMHILISIPPKYKMYKTEYMLKRFDVDNDYFFSDEKRWYTDGGHRTIVAKFGLYMAQEKTGKNYFLKNVKMCYYPIDWNILNIYKKPLSLIKENKWDIYISIYIWTDI